MTTLRDRIETGEFARKQLLCKSRLIAWSHTRRFDTARALVMHARGKKLLDYGCGDGTFVAQVSDLFPDAVGADINEKAVAGCASRYAGVAQLRFVSTRQLDASFDRAFDVVTCMETLEHCVPAAADRVFADLRRLIAPGGRVMISVPIEIGPTLPMKQLMRAIAGMRRLGQYQYRERYAWRELWRMTFATRRTAIERTPYLFDQNDPASEYLGHKGFNWRALREHVAAEFDLLETRFSPLGWSRGFLSSQAWFVCAPRGGGGERT